MNTMSQAFDVAVGYSDHTDGIVIPIAAVAMGAIVIEKHLTLDRNLPGPDHKASLEPEKFATMVNGIRSVEQALGDGIKRSTQSEQNNITAARNSLVASTFIKKDELFSYENLAVKRPGTGLSPMLMDQLIGCRAIKDFEVDEPIVLH